jgi:multimeric flavodoxin WrbA
MKKVLILSGSPRKGGNSDILCDEFMRGALDAGNQVEKIFVADKNVAPCTGCYFCRNHGGRCALNDDMTDILQKIIDCDVLVLSSPVYFYSICAQLKTVIDRTVARWTEIANKDLYYITTAAEDEDDTMDGTIACFHGFAMCIDGYYEKGTLYGRGLQDKNDVADHPEYLTIAYEMGNSIR